MEDPTNPKRRLRNSREPEQRQFTHWAKMNDDGTVAAIIEVAVGAPRPVGAIYVEVTDLWPYELFDAQVTKADIQNDDVIAIRVALRAHNDEKKAAAAAAEQATADARAAEVLRINAEIVRDGG